ncbi:PadR family transcriptional regulator, partial [Streptomyces sp. NPDC055080]
MKDLTEMLKGVLEGVVLQKIQTGETYGYEITRYLNELGFDDIVEGTVYTILVRIEKKGLVEIEKKKSELGPARKFYTLNAKGQKELNDFWHRWSFL